MEIIEKQVEKIKEVPYGYCDNWGHGYGRYGYDGYGRNVNGKANAGMALGIVGTVLGGAALLGRGRGLNLFGNSGYGTSGNGANIAIASCGTGNGVAPTSFQAWEKSCEDALALTNEMWSLKVGTMDSAKAAREVDVNEKFQLWKSQVDADFSLYKSQVDADFGLYKSTRDGFDALTAKQNQDAFALYKNQRDSFDFLSQRISNLETKQAVADAVEPWRAKVLDMRINGVAADAHAGISLEAERRCCADNKIVNYVNSNFYPIEVADLTVAATATARTTSNPLCGCCGSCGGHR